MTIETVSTAVAGWACINCALGAVAVAAHYYFRSLPPVDTAALVQTADTMTRDQVVQEIQRAQEVNGLFGTTPAFHPVTVDAVWATMSYDVRRWWSERGLPMRLLITRPATIQGYLDTIRH